MQVYTDLKSATCPQRKREKAVGGEMYVYAGGEGQIPQQVIHMCNHELQFHI